MLDVELFGRGAVGPHCVNLLLHAASTVLLFLWLRRMTGAQWRSFLVAALFALHPLHVESMAWVAERKDVLSTFFWMLTLLMYAQYVQQSQVPHPGSLRHLPSSIFYLLSLFFFALGLMSKPMLVSVPFVMLLLDYWPLQRFALGSQSSKLKALIPLAREKAPFFLLSALSCVLTALAQRKAMQPLIELTVGARLENAVVSYSRYLSQTIWPARLAMAYPHPGHWPRIEVALAAALFGGLCIAALWTARRFPFVFTGWFWFCGTLIPVIGLVQVGSQAMADRYTYVPLVGVFTVLTWGTHELTKQWRYQVVTLSAGGLVVTCACAALTRQQIAYWKESETLFRHATAVTENNYVSETSLGVALADEGRPEEAIIHYQKALATEPDYADAHSNLGLALAGQGRWKEAITHYKRALEVAPDHADAHNNLGHALLEQGQIEQAIAHFRSALQRKPGFAGALNNLGVALARKGQVDEAIRHFQEALRLKPNSAEAHYDLGTALLQKGQIEPAIIQFQQALRSKPDYADACHNLGNALIQTGKAAEGITCFQRALDLRPDFPEAHNSLGWVFLQKGQLEEAISHFQKALASRPDYAEAHSNLGFALLQKGQVDEAIAQFQKAEGIHPGDAVAQHNLGVALLQGGQVDNAIAHFKKAVEIRPAFAEAHHNLGTALVRKGQVDRAIIHFQKALGIRPDFAEANYSLGNAFLQKGLVSEAAAHFQSALETRLQFPEAQNNLAWVLATSREASARNGARAVGLAQEANRLSGGYNPLFMGTLGAAYAEAGRFAEAVEVAQRALRLAEAQTNRAVADALQKQIKLYQAGLPVREDDQTNSAPETTPPGR